MDTFDIYWFEEHYKDGQCVVENNDSTVCMSEDDDRYIIQTEQASPSMICEFKSYFPDTLGLMEEGRYLKWGDTNIGVWKKYDKTGDVVEEIDYDKDWNITWEKLIPFIQEQDIKMRGIVGIERFEKKNEEDENSTVERVWVIEQMLKSGEELVFHFDGNNGKLIEKITLPPVTP